MQQNGDLDPEEISEGIQNLSLEESIEAGVPHPGLPGPLPPGEEVVWQGVPSWRNLARNMFYTRWIGSYFSVTALIIGLIRKSDGGTLNDSIAAAIPIIFFGVLTVGILSFLAWVGARATIYTITSRRIIMRVGAAFSKSIDIPLNVIESIGLKSLRGGYGNISVKLKPGNSIPYFFIWPHARPWNFRNAQPMLRALTHVDEVSRILLENLEPIAHGASENMDPSKPTYSRAASEEPILHDNKQETPKKPGVTRMKNTERVFFGGAFALVVISLIFITAGQLLNSSSKQNQTNLPKRILEIQVRDIGSGRLSIIDLEKNQTIVILEPGRDGLVRNAIRSLKRIRKQENLPVNDPYQVVSWEDNRLTLSDLRLDRHIPLSSFAPPNTSATVKLKQLVLDRRSTD